eukprot:gb/GEZJ01006306.1/.p1 GENE.gb/GEZJ01006306.1/~~gb/GEZJ01006306.1/.p1  ORF type:complete len:175 (+),score=14.43 gb/GEZJ01006306.1/:223-747(+)
MSLAHPIPTSSNNLQYASKQLQTPANRPQNLRGSCKYGIQHIGTHTLPLLWLRSAFTPHASAHFLQHFAVELPSVGSSRRRAGTSQTQLTRDVTSSRQTPSRAALASQLALKRLHTSRPLVRFGLACDSAASYRPLCASWFIALLGGDQRRMRWQPRAFLCCRYKRVLRDEGET